MAEEKPNKVMTIALILIICIAAVVLLYVNLPSDETTDDTTDDTTNGDTEEPVTVLTVIYGDEQTEYTMDEIKSMTPYTGEGAKINKKLTITGPYNYTGVKMSTLLAEFENLPENYSINTTATDGYPQHYTYEQIQGTVELFNETKVSLGNESVTMIIAYMEEGQDITDPEDGPLMIAFVDDYYTDSGLWARMLETIEIVEE